MARVPGYGCAGRCPAVDDPAFAGSSLDPGYLTTQPGTRGSLFYDPQTADPSVIATDEANKGTATGAELGAAAAIISAPPIQQPSYRINVPVLSVVGEDDALFCTGVTEYNCASTKSVQSFESQYSAPAAHLRVVVIPDTGRDLALSTTAPLTDAAIIGWSLSTITP